MDKITNNDDVLEENVLEIERKRRIRMWILAGGSAIVGALVVLLTANKAEDDEDYEYEDVQASDGAEEDVVEEDISEED